MWRIVCLILVLLNVMGCEQEKVEETVWDDQLKTIERAQDVENTVIEAAKQRREQESQATQ